MQAGAPRQRLPRGQQVSNAGGERPLWSRDGRELFYLEPSVDGVPRLMAVRVATGDAFAVTGRTPVMDWPYLGLDGVNTSGRTYDISPDGRRFLAVKDGDLVAGSTPQVIVVENWFDELRRLIPTEN